MTGSHLHTAGRPLIAASGRAIVVWLAVAVVAAAERPLDAAGLLAVFLAAAIWLLALRAASAGAPHALGPRVPAAMGAVTGLICVAAVNPHLVGLGLSLPTLLGMAVGVFLSSAVWDTVLARTDKRRVLIVGTSAHAEIAAAARAVGRPSFEIIDPPGDGTAHPRHTGLPTLGALDELAAVVDAQRPDLIVLTDDQSCSDALERLLDLTDRRFKVAGLTSFYEYAFGCVPLVHMTPMWFMSLLHLRQRSDRRPSKRLFDVLVATAGLIVMAPFLLVLSLLIKRTPGPVIYRQTRVGAGGRHFTIYKFRTMTDCAEQPGEPVYARDHDPRVTTVGHFLRRTHLDELPQLWNVLRGEMSIVGPRPERPEFVAMLEAGIPFWSRRLLMKPGLTGWAQVRCGYASDCASSAEKLSHDFWYLRHGSLAVDIAVCMRTLLLTLSVLDPRQLRALWR